MPPVANRSRRWLAALAAITIALAMVVAWHLGEKARRQVLNGGGGPPVLVYAEKRSGAKSVEVWDPATGRRRTVIRHIQGDDIRIDWGGAIAVDNGDAVAWIADNTLHWVDWRTGAKRQWPIPEQYAARTWLHHVSLDRRFAVYRLLLPQDDDAMGNPHGTHVTILDLNIGTANTTRDYPRDFYRVNHSGLFVASVSESNKNVPVLVRLDEDGEFQRVTTDIDSGMRPGGDNQYLRGVYFTGGNRRGSAAVIGTFVRSKDERSREIVVELPHESANDWVWQNAEKAAVGSDHLGNQYVADAATGKVIARDMVDQRYTTRTMWLAIASGAMAGLWLVATSFSSPPARWLTAVATVLVGQWTLLLGMLATFTFTGLGPLSGDVWLANSPTTLLVGISVGAIAAAAWLAAYGPRGYFTPIFAVAMAYAAATTLPVLRWFGGYWLYGEWEITNPPVLASNIHAASIVLMGCTAAIVSMPRLFGFRVDDAEGAPKTGARRFGLAAIFRSISFAAVLFALARWLLRDGWRWPAEWEACYLGQGLGLAMTVPSIIFARRAWVKALLAAIAISTVLGVTLYLWSLRFPNGELVSLVRVQAEFVGGMIAVMLPLAWLARNALAMRVRDESYTNGVA